MKKAYIYLTFIVMAVLGTASCSKHSSLDMPEEKEAQENKIGFGSVSAQRAGEVTPDASKKRQIQVYDYYTAEGTSTETEYIDELIQESATAGVWAYVKEGKTHSYSWKKGIHKFFGWEAVDSTGAAAPGLNYNSEDKVLTIAGENNAPVALPGKANTDYRYAEIKKVSYPDKVTFVTDKTTGKKTDVEPIQLTVKHLSAALSYTVENFTGQTYTINSISVSNVVTTAAPAVDFSGDEPATIAYNLGTDKGSVSLVLGEGDNAVKTCVWPQTVEGSKLTVNYKLGTTDKEVTIDIPKTTWKAGKYYNFKLQLVNKTITLTFTVADWETVEGVGDVDTSTGSINMSNVTWMNAKVMVDGVEKNTLDNDDESVTMYKVDGSYKHVIYETYEEDVVNEETGEVIHKAGDVKVYEEDVVDEETGEVHKAGDPIVKIEDVAYAYQPAQGYFTVNYPRTGKYFIAIIPAKGETAVDASKYQIMIYDSKTKSWRDYDAVNGEDVTNDTIYFRVFAAPEQDGKEHKAQIDIWFQPVAGGEKISAYSEIRANYTLIIPAS